MKILQEYREQWKDLEPIERFFGWLLIPAAIQTIILWVALLCIRLS